MKEQVDLLKIQVDYLKDISISLKAIDEYEKQKTQKMEEMQLLEQDKVRIMSAGLELLRRIFPEPEQEA